MKYTYLTTFISGTNQIVTETLQEKILDIEIITSFDGCIVFTTNKDFTKLTKLQFVNNAFLVLHEAKTQSFENSVSWFHTHNIEFVKPAIKKLGFSTFRVLFVDANTFVSYNKKEIALIEHKTKKELQIGINRVSPDTEFWFMKRSEGYCFMLLRLTNESLVEHRKKGQIRPELAHLMCMLSEPNKRDIFLDPFAGYGTIVEAREHYPYDTILGFEKNNTVSSKDTITNRDFFENTMKGGYVSKIVTDPPWGKFDRNLYTKPFYCSMFVEFSRILTSKGLIILLLSRETDVSSLIQTCPLKIVKSYNILVSGKKSTIWKIIKC